jgi:hypothetical protein
MLCFLLTQSRRTQTTAKLTSNKLAGILAERSFLFLSVWWWGGVGDVSRYVTKPNIATQTAGLRLSSAEAERLVETRLVNKTLKDNAQKKTGEKSVIPRQL